MDISNKLSENSQAVQAHLGITQSVIQRMSANSVSCKSWCITLVSAILVIIADKNVADYAYIAIIPTILFLILDAYYLSLEKAFRQIYNDFIEKIHNETINIKDLYSITPQSNTLYNFLESLCSFSIWPFYSTLILMIIITRNIIK